MRKLELKKIVDSMKEVAKIKKPTATKPEPTYRERDMRQEAIDMGSHGAKEYFGEEGVSQR